MSILPYPETACTRGWPHGDAAEVLLRTTCTYPDGTSAWDAFPAEWRQIAKESAKAALADFRNSIVAYPSAADLATITVPVVCSYGSRSRRSMVGLVRSLAAAIPTATTRQIDGAGHAAPFDATDDFVQVIADAIDPVEAVGSRGGSDGMKYQMREKMFVLGDDYWLVVDCRARGSSVRSAR